MSEVTNLVESNSAANPLTGPGGLLSDENIPKLARRAARHVKRPRGVDLIDAEQDAAVELLGYRKTFDLSRSAHLSRERQEALLAHWVRLRLTSTYDSRIAEAVLTRTCGEEHEFGDALARERRDPLDAHDLEEFIATLPRRQRVIVQGVFYEGKEQRQIAQELGISQAVVSREYKAAKDAIREALLCGA